MDLCGKHEELSSAIQIPRTQEKWSKAGSDCSLPSGEAEGENLCRDRAGWLVQIGKLHVEKGTMTQ